MTDKTHYFDWAATAPQDAEIAKLVVDLKSEIEKLREQIQNVE